MEDNENKKIENNTVEANVNDTNVTQPVASKEEKGKGKIVVIIVAVVFLIALAVILFLVAKGFNKKVNDNKPDTGKEIVDKQEEKEPEEDDAPVEIEHDLEIKSYKKTGLYELFQTEKLPVYNFGEKYDDPKEVEIIYPQFTYTTKSVKILNDSIKNKVDELIEQYYVYGVAYKTNNTGDGCMCTKIGEHYACASHLGQYIYNITETNDYILLEHIDNNYTECATGTSLSDYYMISKKTKEVLSSSEIIKVLEYDDVGLMDFVNNQLIKKAITVNDLAEYRETVTYFILGGKLYVTFATSPMDDNYYFMYDGSNFVEYERTDSLSKIEFKKVAKGITLSYKSQTTTNTPTKISVKLAKETSLNNWYESEKLDTYHHTYDSKKYEKTTIYKDDKIIYPQFKYTTKSVKEFNNAILSEANEKIEAYSKSDNSDDVGCVCVKFNGIYHCYAHLFEERYLINETSDYILVEKNSLAHTECASGYNLYSYTMISKSSKNIMTNKDILNKFNYDENDVKAKLKEKLDKWYEESDLYDDSVVDGYNNYFIYDNKFIIAGDDLPGSSSNFFYYDGEKIVRYNRTDNDQIIVLEEYVADGE